MPATARRSPEETASDSNYSHDHLSMEHSLLGTWQRIWQFIVRAWAWLAYGIGSLILASIIIVVVLSLFSSPSDFSSVEVKELYLAGSGQSKIAVFGLDGPVGTVVETLPGSSSSVISIDRVHRDLQQAAADPQVKAVILRINSPGGSAVESDAIYEQLMQFKADTGKPVIASLGDTAASGGYYLALPADRIVANAATITGSIGVILQYYDASGLLQKIGVSPEVIKSGQFKDLGTLHRPTTPEERAILQQVVDDAYQQFVQRVMEGRQMSQDQVQAVADGRIYTGRQAQAVDLVDALGNLDTAISLAKELADVESATVVEYQHGGWFDALLGVSSSMNPLASLQQAIPSNSSSLLYLWQP